MDHIAPMGDIHEDRYCAAGYGSQDTAPSLFKKRAVCRYYQTGNCRRGSSCPFAHFSVAAQIETPAIAHPAYQAEQVYSYPPEQTSVYHPLGTQAYPRFLWQPYPPFSPSFDPRYGLLCQAEILSDYPDDRSDPSSAESSSTATSVDDEVRKTLDTVHSGGSRLGDVRGVANPLGDLRINPSPGYAVYSHPFFPSVEAEYIMGRGRATSLSQYSNQGSTVAHPSAFLLPWQDESRKKPLAYKTKPCRFYVTNGKCTSGEKCTFIHDPESTKGNVEKSPPDLARPNDTKLPPKPINKYDDYRARDFYPITWRVVGGGVLMGGQRQICRAFSAGHCKHGDDCKLAHETELETDPRGYIELRSDIVRKGERSQSQPAKGPIPKNSHSSSQRRKSIKVQFPENQQPEVSPSATANPQRPNMSVLGVMEEVRKREDEVILTSARSAPASPVRRRTRSLSMVLASPAPLDATLFNYAAEL